MTLPHRPSQLTRMNAEYQLGIHLQMTVELHALTTPPYPFVADPSGRCPPPPPTFCLLFFCFLQRRMSVRMDSFSATTKGVYRPSGGATMTTTARTTVMRRIVVSVQISVRWTVLCTYNK